MTLAVITKNQKPKTKNKKKKKGSKQNGIIRLFESFSANRTAINSINRRIHLKKLQNNNILPKVSTSNAEKAKKITQSELTRACTLMPTKV